ncbi:MAG: hypothetical protein AABO41_19870 [Acidobacteriota bacterium]
MKVVCVSNSGKSLPRNYLDSRRGYDSASEFPITVGQEYVVYALALRKNEQVWYYISDDDGLYYPHRYPAPLFEGVDSRLSQYWRFAFTPEHLDHAALFAFEEWVRDEYYYDRLTDKVEDDVSKFSEMKHLMDLENDKSG